MSDTTQSVISLDAVAMGHYEQLLAQLRSPGHRITAPNATF